MAKAKLRVKSQKLVSIGESRFYCATIWLRPVDPAKGLFGFWLFGLIDHQTNHVYCRSSRPLSSKGGSWLRLEIA